MIVQREVIESFPIPFAFRSAVLRHTTGYVYCGKGQQIDLSQPSTVEKLDLWYRQSQRNINHPAPYLGVTWRRG